MYLNNKMEQSLHRRLTSVCVVFFYNQKNVLINTHLTNQYKVSKFSYFQVSLLSESVM